MGRAGLAGGFRTDDLTLRTDDGRVLSIRFSGKRHSRVVRVRMPDVRDGLPEEKQWRR